MKTEINKSTGILLLLFLLCQGKFLIAQAPPIQPLKIQDTVPEEIWNATFQAINYSRRDIKLSEYADKELIILDFWATWCASCLDAIPKIELIQEQFSDQMHVIFVNSKKSGDDRNKINKFLSKYESYTGVKLDFPSIIEDTLLSQLFPYRSIPHYVWLKNGTVEKITSSKEVTAENVQSILAGKGSGIHIKSDILNFDNKDPLFSYAHDEMGDTRLLQSTLTKYIEGVGTATGKNIDEKGNIYRYYIFNTPLIQILRKAFSEIGDVPVNRMILAVDNPEIFASESRAYDNLFCYEIISEPTSMEVINRHLRNDLIRCFNLEVQTEKRQTDVLVLKKVRDFNALFTDGGKSEWRIDRKSKIKYIRNQPVSAFVRLLNITSPTPIIDETDIELNIDLDLPNNLYDLNLSQLQEYLINNGLKLEKERRLLDFVVVRSRYNSDGGSTP